MGVGGARQVAACAQARGIQGHAQGLELLWVWGEGRVPGRVAMAGPEGEVGALKGQVGICYLPSQPPHPPYAILLSLLPEAGQCGQDPTLLASQ